MQLLLIILSMFLALRAADFVIQSAHGTRDALVSLKILFQSGYIDWGV